MLEEINILFQFSIISNMELTVYIDNCMDAIFDMRLHIINKVMGKIEAAEKVIHFQKFAWLILYRLQRHKMEISDKERKCICQISLVKHKYDVQGQYS